MQVTKYRNVEFKYDGRDTLSGTYEITKKIILLPFDNYEKPITIVRLKESQLLQKDWISFLFELKKALEMENIHPD